MKNMIRKALVAVLLLVGISIARADLGWHLAYEHDGSGSAMNGTSFSTLLAAIDAGADVKLLIYPGDNTCTVAIPLNIRVSANRTVLSAQYRELAVTINADGSNSPQSNSFDIDVVVNTTGLVCWSRYYKNGTKYVDSSYNWHVKWFVNN